MTAHSGVLVVGSLNEDVVLVVDRLPGPGETLAARSVSRRPGGKGANQAVAAARTGAVVQMLGRVGDDPAGERLRADLSREGVGHDAVRVLPGCATGTAHITVAADGENTIVLDAGANARLTAGDIDAERERFGQASVLLTQLEIPEAAVTAALALGRDEGLRAVLTLAPAVAAGPELLRGADPLLVNEHEAAIALGAPGAGRAADLALALRDRGARSVVVTLGARGVVVASADGVRASPAPEVAEVRDTTGAGDAFAGALAAALAAGASLDEAVADGQAAGADAVTRPGAR